MWFAPLIPLICYQYQVLSCDRVYHLYQLWQSMPLKTAVVCTTCSTNLVLRIKFQILTILYIMRKQLRKGSSSRIWKKTKKYSLDNVSSAILCNDIIACLSYLNPGSLLLNFLGIWITYSSRIWIENPTLNGPLFEWWSE